MSELAFGSDNPDPGPMPAGDRRFLAGRKDFARGEIRFGNVQEPAFFAAYRHVRERRFPEAVALYDQVLAENPDRVESWVNRGVALQAMGRLEDALASFETAIRKRPGYVAGHINRGIVLNWMCRSEEALEDFGVALDAEPDNESGRLSRSTALSSLNRFHEALADADHVLARNPGSGAGHYNKALLLLSLGEYVEGFREHEWRFGTDSILGRYQFTVQRWLGQPTKKRILVHCEQGLGDQIQFVRYLPLMRERGLDVHLEAPPALLRLLGQLGVSVATYEDRATEFGLHCPIISLGAIFKTSLDTIPAVDGYLKADPELVADWAMALRQHQHPRVGLCWSSGVRPEQPIAVAMQKRKSIPTAAVEPLRDLDGISWVSLQKDVPDGGIPDWLFDPMPQVKDLADTAAIIENLDLVITVDSAVAHLAGALGKPVWVINRRDICWRWLSGERQAPWYRSAKIYQQQHLLDWEPVVSQVRHDLQQELT